MKIPNLSQIEGFEWDEANIDKNRVKHNVSWQETEEVFFNEPLINEDLKHSVSEKRFQTLGKTNNNRFLFVSFTIRNNRYRIISVRDMNKKEKKAYEKT